MRQIRETLRLHLQAGLSYNEVGRALKISKSAVGKYITLARVAGVDWELAQSLSDEELEARVYRPALPRGSHQLAPDFGVVHQELKRPGVTLMLLWEEYATACLLYTSRELQARGTETRLTFKLTARPSWVRVMSNDIDRSLIIRSQHASRCSRR